MSYKVLIVSRSFGKAAPEVLDQLKAAGAEVMLNPHDKTPGELELLGLVKDVDVIVSGNEPITARVLAAAPQLKGIAKHGVSCENIDLAAVKARKIWVAIADEAITDSVADMVLALLLALARRVPFGDRAVKAGRWGRVTGVALSGKTLGLVGLGLIGKAVCQRAKGFGMNVIAFDGEPVKQDAASAAQWGVQYVALAALLQQADFISLHTPASPGAREIISKASLEQMKPTAFLINTARSELVDEGALYIALKRNQIAGAASDVFMDEPPGPNPLLELDNFIAFPHSAGQTHESLRAMDALTCDNVLRMLKGERLPHWVA